MAHLTIEGMPRSLQRLDHSAEHPLFDAAIPILHTMFWENDKATPALELIVSDQIYPNPNLCLQLSNFVQLLNNIEPGHKIDYSKLEADLHLVKDDVTNETSSLSRMYHVYNALINTSARYVEALCHAIIFNLYRRMIDHCYGRVFDHKCEFLIGRLGQLLPRYSQLWPEYEAIKYHYECTAKAWEDYADQATEELVELKDSQETRWFFAKLNMALQARSERVHHRAQAGLAVRAGEAASAARNARRTQARLQSRRQLIARRKQLEQKLFVLKNRDLKDVNVNNLWQIGEAGRHDLEEDVIKALADGQEMRIKEMVPDEDEMEYTKEELKERKRLKAEMEKAGFLPNATDQVFDGIVIPEGFKLWKEGGNPGQSNDS